MIDIEKVVSAINYNGNPMELAGGGGGSSWQTAHTTTTGGSTAHISGIDLTNAKTIIFDLVCQDTDGNNTSLYAGRAVWFPSSLLTAELDEARTATTTSGGNTFTHNVAVKNYSMWSSVELFGFGGSNTNSSIPAISITANDISLGFNYSLQPSKTYDVYIKWI